MKSPVATSGQRSRLTSSLVIALTLSVILTAVQCTSIASDSKPAAAATAPSSTIAHQPTIAVSESKSIAETSVESQQASKQAAPVEPVAASKAQASETSSGEQEASARRGRSEAPPASTEKPAPVTEKPAGDDKKTGSKIAEAPKAAATKQSSSSKQQLSGKSGVSSGNKKLPANLGTVTSTGSGGPAHYMSKHDAYSAIAEKHGALAQDAMRKADKRQQHHNLHQRFGGIQKASGLGDMMSPFKGVTDSGLARTLGASVRSIIKGKYSVPAYVASAVLGAVALMAFYESPISPLPVPALPEPPVGRFPPEMPNISPNLQVPFRMNNQQQQGQYGQAYQRSFQAGPQQQQQQPQQVLFPGASAQQRSSQASPASGAAQLAANLISSVAPNRQTAQRKSSLDYDGASSRSFFGSSSGGHQQAAATSGGPNAKLAAPADSHHNQQQQQQHHKSSSILSFFGLGGGGGSEGASASSATSALGNLDIQRASGLSGHHQIAAGGGPISSASGSEQKGQAALSNSHLVNKMKSYFDRPIGHTIWPVEHYAPNQYDQYRRMSIVQALAKDTAFLSSFFSPSRRSSNATLSASQIQQSISNVLAAAAGGSSASSTSSSQAQAASNVQQAASRMQVDSPTFTYGLQQQQQQPQQPIVNTKRASSGYGLMRAADRIGHALLDTFLHRSSQAQVDSVAARKSEEQQQQNALASATSLLSDIMSSYNAAQQVQQQHQQQQQQQPAAVPVAEQQGKQSPEAAGKASVQQAAGSDLAQGRSADQAPAVSSQPSEKQQVAGQQSKSHSQQQQQSAVVQPSESVVSSSASSQSQQAPLVRKTRSIGLDYPMEPMQPSRASQINNLVDMVSDSYKQNKLLFSFVMNQVGLSHALPYVDQFLGTPNEPKDQHV